MIVVSLYHKLNLFLFHEIREECVFSRVDIIFTGVEAEDR